MAIEGLTATPDGRVIGFVEFDITHLEDDQDPQLVLLDGASFEELVRIDLPLAAGESAGAPTVSMSAGGQRILVTLGGQATGLPAVPTTPYFVRGALTAKPQVFPMGFRGVLRWFDPWQRPAAVAWPPRPSATSPSASSPTQRRRARKPFSEVPIASEVLLWLGPTSSGELAPGQRPGDPSAWQLEPESGSFRAYDGPFSALDTLSEADNIVISGGTHSHGASPPMPVPDQVAGLRHISIQPTDIDSSLEWFTVDLFLTDSGEIAAVTLDLWEP